MEPAFHKYTIKGTVGAILTSRPEFDTSSPLAVEFEKNHENLNRSKDQMDQYKDSSFKRLLSVLAMLDFYSELRSEIKGAQIVTNAWLKMHEMYSELKLKGPFNMFGNAELPGTFISATNHNCTFQGERFEWVANSLMPKTDKTKGKNNTALGDTYGLYEMNKDHWLMNGRNDGDLMKARNVLDLAVRARKKLDINLYTADGGIDMGSNYNLQEIMNLPLHAGQDVCGLLALSPGGVFLSKHYTLAHPYSISSVLFLSTLFDEFCIVKPRTSRPSNSETYLYGRGYKGMPEEVAEKLIKRLSTADFSYPLVDLKKATGADDLLKATLALNKEQMKWIDYAIMLHSHKDAASVIKDDKRRAKKAWLRRFPVRPLPGYAKLNLRQLKY